MLFLIALNPTDAVLEGFLPAADRLGLPVTVLTDQPSSWPPVNANVERCDVRDARAIITAAPVAEALLSNSDHLQVPTALAADYLGLPGKDWRAALRCKDKNLMRRALAHLDPVASAVLPLDGPFPFPAVVKPREGVASEDAYLVADAHELAARAAEIWARKPGIVLVVEEYLHGELNTFETLGDGKSLASLGGWHTKLGAPPTFIEESLEWNPQPPSLRLSTQLDVLGVGFGACHTEFVVQDGKPRLIEVNYRLIGDRMDLILAELLGIPLFEYVIRLHLGESLSGMPLPDPAAVKAFARVEYICADRPGTLIEAPLSSPGCRPLRTLGTAMPLTGTNRDYLAVLHAVGADKDGVAQQLLELRKGLSWKIA